MKGYAWELFRVLLETDLPGLTDLRAPPPLRKLRGSRGRTANFFFEATIFEAIISLFV